MNPDKGDVEIYKTAVSLTMNLPKILSDYDENRPSAWAMPKNWTWFWDRRRRFEPVRLEVLLPQWCFPFAKILCKKILELEKSEIYNKYKEKKWAMSSPQKCNQGVEEGNFVTGRRRKWAVTSLKPNRYHPTFQERRYGKGGGFEGGNEKKHLPSLCHAPRPYFWTLWNWSYPRFWRAHHY